MISFGKDARRRMGSGAALSGAVSHGAARRWVPGPPLRCEAQLGSAEVPTKVAINEALELAKRYSTAQSSRFVNGILDRLQAAAIKNPEAKTGPEGETDGGETPTA